MENTSTIIVITPSSETVNITYKAAFYAVMRMSVPLLVRAASMITQVIAKRVLLAQEDSTLIEAFAGIAAIEDLIFLASFGAQSYITTIISEKKAADPDNPQKIGELFQQGLFFSKTIVAADTIPCIFAPWIYQLTQQPTVVIESSDVYFSIAFFAYLFDLLYRAMVRASIAIELTTPPLIGDIGEGILDIGFSYLFINVFKLGVAGSALAYLLAAIPVCLSYGFYLSQKSELTRYELFHFKNGIDFDSLKKMAVNGATQGFNASIEYIPQLLITLYCGLSGKAPLIGIQAAAAYSILINFILGAFCDSANVFIAKSIGENNKNYKTFANINLLLCTGYASFCAIVLFSFIDDATSFFIKKETASTEEIETVKYFLMIQAFFEIINSIRNSYNTALYACSQVRAPFYGGVIFMLGVSTLLSTSAQFVFKTKPTITYATQLIGCLLACITSVTAWHGYKKRRSTLFSEASLPIAQNTSQASLSKI